jgi:hypothetical protein
MNEYWELRLVNRWSGKCYQSENFDNEDDAIAEGDRFYKEFAYKNESDLILEHHVRVDETVKVWSIDNKTFE